MLERERDAQQRRLTPSATEEGNAHRHSEHKSSGRGHARITRDGRDARAAAARATISVRVIHHARRPTARGEERVKSVLVHQGIYAFVARHAPRIGALVLAAGRSTRFGSDNKLLADLDGRPIVRRTVEAILASRARPVTVVTGHMAEQVAGALAGLDVAIVHNPDFVAGLSSSLKAGLRALPPGLDGYIVALGDMPRVEGAHVDRLIAGFAPKEGRSIVVPVHGGKRGNPVLFAVGYLTEMLDVAGDTGARHIIGAHADEVVEVDLATGAIFIDVDTLEALANLKRDT